MSPMKKARREKGLTQDELAKQLGCTQTHVSDVERGRAVASAKLAAAIASVLNIPEEQILYPERFTKE